MKNKSLKMNIALNGIKTITTMIFPIITFPYISRVLQVDNLGKVNFATSIVNYFLLIAGLGISTYATREGARLRDDNKNLNEFCNQIFTINIISTIISYILLILILFSSKKLQLYKLLILIQSLNIIGNTLGVNWVYSIYEDYLYITIRTIIFQIISLVLLFIFVREMNDYIEYAWILVISNSGSNILNYINSKRYLNIRITKNINFKKHLKPIFIIFASAIATTIYVNSDSTMLGIICDDYSVGLYGASVKVYMILKSLVASAILVTLPRLSNYIANGKLDEFKITAYEIFDLTMILLLPIVIGILMTAKEIILIVSGPSYIDSVTSLKLLSISLVFSILAVFCTNAILLPMEFEKTVMKSTISSAIANIVLNLFFIKTMKQNGAAITTIISEIIVFYIQYRIVKKYIPIKFDIKNYYSLVLGCIGIVVSCAVIDIIFKNFIIVFILKVIISASIYILILVSCKNKVFMKFIKPILKNT